MRKPNEKLSENSNEANLDDMKSYGPPIPECADRTSISAYIECVVKLNMLSPHIYDISAEAKSKAALGNHCGSAAYYLMLIDALGYISEKNKFPCELAAKAGITLASELIKAESSSRHKLKFNGYRGAIYFRSLLKCQMQYSVGDVDPGTKVASLSAKQGEKFINNSSAIFKKIRSELDLSDEDRRDTQLVVESAEQASDLLRRFRVQNKKCQMEMDDIRSMLKK